MPPPLTVPSSRRRCLRDSRKQFVAVPLNDVQSESPQSKIGHLLANSIFLCQEMMAGDESALRVGDWEQVRVWRMRRAAHREDVAWWLAESVSSGWRLEGQRVHWDPG